MTALQLIDLPPLHVLRVRALTRALTALATLALCAGCSSRDDGDAGDTDRPDGGGGAATALVGSFLVKLVPAKDDRAAYTSFLGKLFDAPQLPLVPLVLDSEEGECRLLVPEVPFCDPECSDGVCSADDECTPISTPQSAGTVRVEGLGEPFMLAPMGGSFTYMPAMSLPHPPCAEGEPIRVSADAFALQAQCVAPLVLTGSDPIPVGTGQPVAIAWTPGTTPDARVRIVLDIAHHGGQKGEIDCEVPDSGAFAIPESLVTKLVNLGVAGFPTVVVSRVSTGAAEANPDVTLTVASEVERAVDTGVISCGSDQDCPEGMTCMSSHFICAQ